MQHPYEVPASYPGGPDQERLPARSEIGTGPEVTGPEHQDARGQVVGVLAPYLAAQAGAEHTDHTPGGTSTVNGGYSSLPDSRIQQEHGRRRPSWLTRPRAAGAIVILAAGLTFAVVEANSGSGGVSIAQAASPNTLEYTNMPGQTTTSEALIEWRLDQAHELLEAYKPFIIEAASDPRAGDPNAMPNHADEAIVQIALLFSGNPNNPLGPVPIPAKEDKKLVAQINKTGTDENLGLPPISEDPQTPDEIIAANMRAALLEVRTLWAQWPGVKSEVGGHLATITSGGKREQVRVGVHAVYVKSVTGFAGYYFGTAGPLAERIEASWGGQSDLAVQALLSNNKFANNGLRIAFDALVNDMIISTSNASGSS